MKRASREERLKEKQRADNITNLGLAMLASLDRLRAQVMIDTAKRIIGQKESAGMESKRAGGAGNVAG